MKPHYYNEWDKYAAQWLRNLIAAGHLPAGEVDERSITEVQPDDLRGFVSCHFFAGIGGWAYAARLAGWPDDRPMWSGSCPCQPFSVAGSGGGAADTRHLWPDQFRLIRACRPPVWVGEQVAAAVGKDWLDGVLSDLESIGYSCGAVVVPACAVDAPHRRDRLWIVADANARGWKSGNGDLPSAGHGNPFAAGRSDVGVVCSGSPTIGGDPERARLEGHAGHVDHRDRPGRLDAHALGSVTQAGGGMRPVAHSDVAVAGEGRLQRGGAVGGPGSDPAACSSGAMANSNCSAGPEHEHQPGGQSTSPASDAAEHPSVSFWAAAEWIIGYDGKARRIKPGLPLLAHGIPARVGKLRAYGNAIVPQEAAEVIGAYLDCRP